MNAVALALVLLTGQSDDFFMDEKPEKPSRIADARAGGGGAAIVDVPGVGMAAEAGLELKPWGPVALRVTLGSNLKIGWGTFFFAPEAVLRLNDVHSTYSPYVALGANLALINITDQALGIDRIPTLRQNQGAATGDGGNPRPDVAAAGTPGPLALKGSIGPQATVGLRWQAFKRLALDVGGRWTLLHFDRKAYQNFALVLTVCAPST